MAKHLPPERRRKRHPFQGTIPKSHKPPSPVEAFSLWEMPRYNGGLERFLKTSKVDFGITNLPRTRQNTGAAILYALKLLATVDSYDIVPLGVPLPENKEHWNLEGVQKFVSRIRSQEDADRLRIASDHLSYMMRPTPNRLNSRESWEVAIRQGAVQVSLEHFLQPVRYTLGYSSDNFLRDSKQTLLGHLLVQLWSTQSTPLESTMRRTFEDMGALGCIWDYARVTDYRLKSDGLAAMFHKDSLDYPELTAHLVASSPKPPSYDLLVRFATTPSHVLQQAEKDVRECQWGVMRDPIAFAWAREMPWLVELIWKARQLPSIELVQDWRSTLPKLTSVALGN